MTNDKNTPKSDEPEPMTSAAPLETEPRRGLSRGAKIGIAVAVGAILFGGAGVAIGASISDDDDDSRPPAGNQRADDRDNDPDDDRDDQPSGNDPSAADLPADAAALSDAIDAAIAAAGGTGATSIDLDSGHYEVEVVLADGKDVDVHVAADGTATVVPDNDQDDDANDPVLDTANLDAVLDAALAAAQKEAGNGGVIDSVSTSDDPGRAFDVTVRMPNGADVDVDLAADLSVVATELDD